MKSVCVASLWLPLWLTLVSPGLAAAEQGAEVNQKCLLLYSYHVGYAWNDAVDYGATQTLGESCTIRRFFLDSKRNPDPSYVRTKALEVKRLIDRSSPDVIIAVDDNVSKYVVVPHLKEGKIPVIFCGVNWTTDEYGYPLPNMTGMVEVAPFDPLFHQVEKMLDGRLKHSKQKKLQVAMIDADRLTAHKQFDQISFRYGHKMDFTAHYVANFSEWKQTFLQAQNADLVVLMNYSGIQGWSQSEAESFVKQHTSTLSVSVHDWMKELVTLVMAKEPEEQGEWAAVVAKMVLQGKPAESIPVVRNRRWKTYANRTLLRKVAVDLPESVRERAIWVGH